MATVVYAANTFDEVLATFEPGELGMAWTAYHKQVSASFLCVAAAPLVPQQIAILKFKGGDHVARALVGSTLNPNADTFKAFVDEISAYFTPPCTTIFCGYQMNKLTQRDGEGIDLFYERLVRLSKSAPFTDAQREAEIIKSMALGTNNSKLAGIILGTETPTVVEIIKKGRSLEKVNSEVQRITAQKSANADELNAITSNRFNKEAVDQSSRQETSMCGNCGTNHTKEVRCIASGRECFNCGKPNHLSRMCRQPRTQQRGNQARQPQHTQRQHQMGTQRPSYQPPSFYQNRHAQVQPGQFHAPQQVNMLNNGMSQYQPYNVTPQQQVYQQNPFQFQQQQYAQEASQTPSTVTENEWRTQQQHINSDISWSLNHHQVNEELLAIGTPSLVQQKAMRSILIEGKKVRVLADTGSTVNIIVVPDVNLSMIAERLRPSSKIVFGYNAAKPLNIIGEFYTELKTKKKSHWDWVQVLQGPGRNILGSVAAQALGLIIIPDEEVFELNTADSMEHKYPKLFSRSVGLIKSSMVTLNIDPFIKPTACNLRRVPYHDVERVTTELKRMLEQQIIEVVPPSTPCPWVSQMMIVRKKDGTPRVCIDSRNINKAIQMEHWPMRTIEDIRYAINGAERISKIDLNKAYFQLQLHPNSRFITTFITHLGLLRYTRMFMGLNAASAAFQREISVHTSDLQGVIHVSDDILVHGSTENIVERTENCLDRLQSIGATAGIGKCRFYKKRVKFFGVVFSGKGMAPTNERVRALLNAKQPSTASEVRSLLGSVNFSSGFIKDLASIATPLRLISRDSSKFVWGDEQQQSWDKIKKSLTTTALAHFNTKWHSQVVVDASPIGLGAILQQINPENENDARFVNFASRPLTEVEVRFPHIEKEAKACVYGCEKHHLYIAGCRFKLITDNKPVEMIIRNPSSSPSARIQKMIVRLSCYTFDIVHKPGYYNEADILSRHPLAWDDQHADEDDCDSEDEYENEVMESHINALVSTNIPKCITRAQLVAATMEDAELEQVKTHLVADSKMPEELKAYQAIRNEITVTTDGLLIRLHKVIVPQRLQATVIKQAHAGHQGATRTLSLLATAVWFPAARKMVDAFVSQCNCQAESARVNPPPLRMSPMPNGPWWLVSTDLYSVSNSGVKLLSLICQFSRYPIVIEFTSTTATAVIPKLIIVFAEFGNPHEIRSDNGPPYNSYEFEMFLKERNIIHIKTIPASPNCNGQCENLNKVFNKAIRIAKLEARPWRAVLQEALLNYRTTPHSSTGYPPATLMFNRQIRGVLPAMVSIPVIDIHQMQSRAAANDLVSKETMKAYADTRRHAKVHTFQKGDKVRVIQAKRNKLDTKFDGETLIVDSVDGVKIVAFKPSNQSMVTRHASQFALVKEIQNCNNKSKQSAGKEPRALTAVSNSRVRLGYATAILIPDEIEPIEEEPLTPRETPAGGFANPLESSQVSDEVFVEANEFDGTSESEEETVSVQNRVVPNPPPIEEWIATEQLRDQPALLKRGKLSSQLRKQIKLTENKKASRVYREERPTR